MILFTRCKQVIQEEKVYWPDNAIENENPFDIDLSTGFILLPIEAENDTLKFIFDTGVDEILLFPNKRTTKLNFRKGDQLNSRQGLHTIDGYMLHNLSFEFASIQFEKMSAIMTDMNRFPVEFRSYIEQKEIDGMIGYDILKFAPVELDIRSGRGIIYRNAIQVDEDSVTTTELSFVDNKPYITSRIKFDSIDIGVKLHLDLGNLGTLELIPSTLDDFTLPVNSEKSEGYGISGKYDIYLGITNQLQIGEITIDSIPTAYIMENLYEETGRNGKIGLEVLKPFRMILDYQNERLILQRE
ncbi:MAG: hypothetical protein KDC80_16360 [Saprospiraceae bacterium]|nr:hypothetical protein [Saprospiraceae bacterium]